MAKKLEWVTLTDDASQSAMTAVGLVVVSPAPYGGFNWRFLCGELARGWAHDRKRAKADVNALIATLDLYPGGVTK